MTLGKEYVLAAALVLASSLPVLAQSTQVATGADAKGQCSTSKECTGGKKMCHGHRGGGMRHGGNAFGLLQGKFALTAEQTAKIDALRTQFRAELKPKFKDMWTTRKEMMSLLTAPQIDTTKVQDLQNQINERMASFANARLQNKVAEFQVLTSEQRQELKAQFEKKRAEHEARRANKTEKS